MPPFEKGCPPGPGRPRSLRRELARLEERVAIMRGLLEDGERWSREEMKRQEMMKQKAIALGLAGVPKDEAVRLMCDSEAWAEWTMRRQAELITSLMQQVKDLFEGVLPTRRDLIEKYDREAVEAVDRELGIDPRRTAGEEPGGLLRDALGVDPKDDFAQRAMVAAAAMERLVPEDDTPQ